jgi:hypothetical protein
MHVRPGRLSDEIGGFFALVSVLLLLTRCASQQQEGGSQQEETGGNQEEDQNTVQAQYEGTSQQQVDAVDELIEQFHLAQGEFVKGNPEPCKSLFSHREDVTLNNP